MKSFWLAVCGISFSLNFAQGVNVSGTVTDNATGRPIHLARVVMETAGLSAYTDIEGNFLITDQSAGTESPELTHKFPRVSAGGAVSVVLSSKVLVELQVHSLSGRLLFQYGNELSPGEHQLTPRLNQTGVQIYNLSIGEHKYTVKRVHTGKNSQHRPAFTGVSGTAGSTLVKTGAENVTASHPWYSPGVSVITGNVAGDIEIKLNANGHIGSQLPDPGTTPPDNSKPVKVYIMSGQSNMVGIGEVGPRSMTRFDTYESAEPDAPEGVILSTYDVAFSAGTDYDALTAVSTENVRVGYWPHDPFPDTQAPFTHVVRGFIDVKIAGLYSFVPASSAAMLQVGDEEIFNIETTGEGVYAQVTLEPGRIPIKIIYSGRGATNLQYELYGVPGQLITLAQTQGIFPHTVDEEGNWTERNDVWYTGVVTATADKWLSIGCGANDAQIGPELQFGHIMGEFHDEPVLLLKMSQGNRSLGWDILPPGSERYEYEDRTYAGYRDSLDSWPTSLGYDGARTTCENVNQTTGNCFVPWYAGLQYDDYVTGAHDVLDNFDTRFPQWAAQGYEIAGFVWWQGHKDSPLGHANRYEHNLVHLINTLRSEFEAPDAPVVISTIGFGGWDMATRNEGHGIVAEAQLAVSGETGKYPEFVDNVLTVESRNHWIEAELSPRDQDFHYNGNAQTYMMVGDALGIGMRYLKQMQ